MNRALTDLLERYHSKIGTEESFQQPTEETEMLRKEFLIELFGPTVLGNEEVFRSFSGGNISTEDKLYVYDHPAEPMLTYVETGTRQMLAINLGSKEKDKGIFSRSKETGRVRFYHCQLARDRPLFEEEKTPDQECITPLPAHLNYDVRLEELNLAMLSFIPSKGQGNHFPSFYRIVSTLVKEK